MGGAMKLFLNFLIGLVGFIFLVFGLIALLSPIPFGFIFVALGLIMLIIAAPPVRRWLKRLRKRWPWLNRQLSQAQEKLPETIAEPLRESEPEEDDSADDEVADDQTAGGETNADASR